jgi:L-aspartate oxidase
VFDIFARVTVLATGGVGYLYLNTSNPDIATGDGIAIAFRAGAVVEDMEFVQFHPTTLNKLGAPHFLVSESLRGEGAILINESGDRFMLKHDSMGELAPRDIIARTIFNELKSGPVYLDFRHKGEAFILDRFPMIYNECLKYDIDITKDLIPVSPAAHYLCGGIKTNEYGQTSVSNLLAFGECTCTGVHGANRLASNSLLESVVFSTLGAKKAKNYLKTSIHSLPENTVKFANIDTLELTYLKADLRKSMWDYVGIIRNKENIGLMLEKLKRSHTRLKSIGGFGVNSRLLELVNMVTVANLITTAAFARTESRGTHYRQDFPVTDDETWLKHICLQKQNRIVETFFS